MNDPVTIADLIAPALDGILRALSDRGGLGEAARAAKADAALRLILAFRPRDAIELTLSGQAVLFNALLADGAHDVLCGMTGERKPYSLSLLVGMGRLAQGHVDRLERRGNQPCRFAAGDAIEAAVVPDIAAPAVHGATTGGGMPTGEPAVETSWLDAPFEQWVIETPADAAERSPANRGTIGRDDRSGAGWREAALPRPASGYAPVRALRDTAAGD